MEQRVTLFSYQDKQAHTLYLSNPDKQPIKDLLLQTIIDCLQLQPSREDQAEALMLKNHLNIHDLILHQQAIAPNATFPPQLNQFAATVQQQNLSGSISWNQAKDKVKNMFKSKSIPKNKKMMLRKSLETQFPELNQNHPDYDLMSPKKQQRLFQWLNLCFDIAHGYIEIDDRTDLDNQAAYRPMNFCYCDYTNDFIYPMDTENQLYTYLIDDQLKTDIRQLATRAREIDNEADKKAIQHAVVTLCLMAKHHETARALVVKNSNTYTHINNRRAKNWLHQLFIWCTFFWQKTTQSQQRFNDLTQKYYTHPRSPSLFKPADSIVLYRVSRMKEIDEPHKQHYVYIKEKEQLIYIDAEGKQFSVDNNQDASPP